MAKAISLVHPREPIKAPAGILVPKCKTFADGPTFLAALYGLTSFAFVADLRQFVSALEGKAVATMKENIGGLSLLFDDFGLEKLAAKLWEFR
jgi:hypothetical protein